MRKHIILFFSALLFLFACKGNKTTGIIDDDAMVGLLVDMHLVDGSLYDRAGVDSLYKYGTARYMYVFKKHHTDTAQFKRSMKYYTLHTDKLLPMYDTILKILQRKTDSVNRIKVIVKDTSNTKKDTIKGKKDTIKGKKDSIKTKKNITKEPFRLQPNKNALPK